MENKWEEMSGKGKREARLQTWPFAECVKFERPEAENTYKKAIMRFKDAVLMEKTPDRVPIFSTWTLDDSDGYGFCYKSSVFDTSKKPGFDFQDLISICSPGIDSRLCF
jgi:hypothetical protein